MVTRKRCKRKECRKQIPDNRGRYNARFCSERCSAIVSSAAYIARYPRTFTQPLSSGTKGAISELIVSADLMLRGFEVFRALSQACSCDLSIRYNDQFYGVEVKTGRVKKNGNGLGPQKIKSVRAPILAIVYGPEKRVEYHTKIPDLPLS